MGCKQNFNPPVAPENIARTSGSTIDTEQFEEEELLRIAVQRQFEEEPAPKFACAKFQELELQPEEAFTRVNNCIPATLVFAPP